MNLADIPAEQSLPDVTSDFVNSSSLKVATIVINIVFLSLATMVVSLHLYARFAVSRNIGSSDWVRVRHSRCLPRCPPRDGQSSRMRLIQSRMYPPPRRTSSYRTVEGALQHPEDVTKSEHQRPLNVTGTQFILPSQIDPTVLAELPADIRSKLAPKQKSIFDNVARPASPQPNSKSRSASPQVSENGLGLPNQSQIDPATLAELPEDVRRELLEHYRSSTKNMNGQQLQQVLPQSPRKAKTTPSSKKLVLTPTKKQKFSSIATKGRSRTNQNSTSTLTQANFVSKPKGAGASVAAMDEEISQSFLEELPEDIRLEILAEQKRNRLKAKSGLNIGTTKRRPKAGTTESDLHRGQQKLALPAQPPKPTFTSRKLSTLSELRAAMDAWVGEFSEGDEGPYKEDVKALGQYLERVIVEEGDMDQGRNCCEMARPCFGYANILKP